MGRGPDRPDPCILPHIDPSPVYQPIPTPFDHTHSLSCMQLAAIPCCNYLAPCAYSPRPKPSYIHAWRTVWYNLESKLYCIVLIWSGRWNFRLEYTVGFVLWNGCCKVEVSEYLMWSGGVRTVRVLGDIKFTKDHDGLVSQIPTVGLIPRMFRMHDPGFLVLQKAKGTKVKGEGITLDLHPKRFHTLQICRSRIHSRLRGCRVA